MIEYNKLEAYKKAIQSQFDTEKSKYYSNFLMSPSRANLRKLCSERMKNNKNEDDLNSFALFLGFEFSLFNANKLKKHNDKFRPIETFFKRETDLSELEAVNMAAILVDFQPRPFLKFSELFNGKGIDNEIKAEDVNTNDDNQKASPFGLTSSSDTRTLVFEPKSDFKKKFGYGALGVVGLFTIGYTTRDVLFPEKQCMKWVQDHYEMVNCLNEAQGLGSYGTIVPYDQREFNRVELKVCDTTEFFVDGNREKPKVWYDKEKDVLHYFNMDGVNPETNDHLKPITDYMIGKYVGPCK